MYGKFKKFWVQIELLRIEFLVETFYESLDLLLSNVAIRCPAGGHWHTVRTFVSNGRLFKWPGSRFKQIPVESSRIL